MSHTYKKILAVILCSIFFLMPLKKSDAGETLIDLRDIVSSKTPMVTSNHTISFGLDPSATPIDSTDFIIISLPKYSAISVPTNIIGTYTGTPEYSVSGKDVRITGIKVQPGDSISIYGILSDNPELDIDFYGNIQIGSYQGGYFNARITAKFIPLARTGYVLVRATIDRPVASLQVKGYAPQGMFLSLVESNDSAVILGTAVATWNGTVGEFSINVPSVDQGDQIHSFMLSGTDSNGRLTPTVVIEEFLPTGTKVIISNVIMPPTISLSSSSELPVENGVVSIQRGDTVTVTGSTLPQSQVQIMTEPPYESFSVMSDDKGDFSYIFDSDKTSIMEFGDHKVNSFVTYAQKSLVSSFSFTRFFKVLQPEDPDKPPCNVTKGDLNCDNKINLIDFSILLYFWGTESIKADMNDDHKVNLVDFSIMMFYWEG